MHEAHDYNILYVGVVAFWWTWTFDPCDPKWPRMICLNHNFCKRYLADANAWVTWPYQMSSVRVAFVLKIWKLPVWPTHSLPDLWPQFGHVTRVRCKTCYCDCDQVLSIADKVCLRCLTCRQKEEEEHRIRYTKTVRAITFEDVFERRG